MLWKIGSLCIFTLCVNIMLSAFLYANADEDRDRFAKVYQQEGNQVAIIDRLLGKVYLANAGNVNSLDAIYEVKGEISDFTFQGRFLFLVDGNNEIRSKLIHRLDLSGAGQPVTFSLPEKQSGIFSPKIQFVLPDGILLANSESGTDAAYHAVGALDSKISRSGVVGLPWKQVFFEAYSPPTLLLESEDVDELLYLTRSGRVFNFNVSLGNSNQVTPLTKDRLFLVDLVNSSIYGESVYIFYSVGSKELKRYSYQKDLKRLEFLGSIPLPSSFVELMSKKLLSPARYSSFEIYSELRKFKLNTSKNLRRALLFDSASRSVLLYDSSGELLQKWNDVDDPSSFMFIDSEVFRITGAKLSKLSMDDNTVFSCSESDAGRTCVGSGVDELTSKPVILSGYNSTVERLLAEDDINLSDEEMRELLLKVSASLPASQDPGLLLGNMIGFFTDRAKFVERLKKLELLGFSYSDLFLDPEVSAPACEPVFLDKKNWCSALGMAKFVTELRKEVSPGLLKVNSAFGTCENSDEDFRSLEFSVNDSSPELWLKSLEKLKKNNLFRGSYRQINDVKGEIVLESEYLWVLVGRGLEKGALRSSNFDVNSTESFFGSTHKPELLVNLRASPPSKTESGFKLGTKISLLNSRLRFFSDDPNKTMFLKDTVSHSIENDEGKIGRLWAGGVVHRASDAVGSSPREWLVVVASTPRLENIVKSKQELSFDFPQRDFKIFNSADGMYAITAGDSLSQLESKQLALEMRCLGVSKDAFMLLPSKDWGLYEEPDNVGP